MQIFIGVDGGGSGCRARAELADGRSTPVFDGGAANAFSDFEGALAQVTSLIAQALDGARTLCPTADTARPQIVLGLAGASETDAPARLKCALPYPDVIVCGDIDISLAGALQDRDGIVMAVGTGSVLARQRDGAMRRIGGHGFTLGDEGSGAWMGREALRRSLHARDGVGPAGPLSDAIWSRFGTLDETIGFSGRARPSDYARLAPEVLDHDRAGCPVAGAILDEGCAYLLAAITCLQDGDLSLPVSPLGGLGPVLLDRIMQGGGAHLNRVAPVGSALDGAIRRARSSLGRKEARGTW